MLTSQLRFLGFDEAQGHLSAKPLAARDLEEWLRERGEAGRAASRKARLVS